MEYVQPLLDFKAKVELLKLDLPLILHAGETLGDGDAPDSNLYDAILLGTKRIGHGSAEKKIPDESDWSSYNQFFACQTSWADENM